MKKEGMERDGSHSIGNRPLGQKAKPRCKQQHIDNQAGPARRPFQQIIQNNRNADYAALAKLVRNDKDVDTERKGESPRHDDE
ncbi:hypothetical protein D3C73_1497310 [compost metagenome]